MSNDKKFVQEFFAGKIAVPTVEPENVYPEDDYGYQQNDLEVDQYVEDCQFER